MNNTHATSKQRWRGIIKLAADAVTVGSTRIEKIQQQLFERPVMLIQTVLGPKAELATASVTIVHHSVVAASHVAIRLTAHAVDSLAGVILRDPPPDAPHPHDATPDHDP